MEISAAALNGLGQAQSAFQAAASRVGNPAQLGAEDAVSLSDNAVALIQSKNQFASDIAVAKVADALTRSSLDLAG